MNDDLGMKKFVCLIVEFQNEEIFEGIIQSDVLIFHSKITRDRLTGVFIANTDEIIN